MKAGQLKVCEPEGFSSMLTVSDVVGAPWDDDYEEALQLIRLHFIHHDTVSTLHLHHQHASSVWTSDSA